MTIDLGLGLAALILAAFPFAMALANLAVFRRPAPATEPAPLSVLIPARNEEANIGDAVRAVLANQGVTFELVVLDDGSTDGTASILAGIDDPRLRVITGPALPAGWSGKQHACAVLSRAARHDLMVFTDADVRLTPDALVRMAGFMARSGVGLGSGFPRQVVCTWAEQLLLPLIHFLLLGYLPMAVMQRSMSPGLGAGCGQLFIARRDAYDAAGGHAAIRASLHDGITLPRAFRRAGQMTGLFDATGLASVRMYHSAQEVWAGLGKNATEGMAKPLPLVVWSVLLFGGHVLPLLLMLTAPTTAAMMALVLSVGLRLILAVRFRQPEVSAWLHPLGILGVLAVQWNALGRALRGRPAMWRGRAYPAQ